MMDIYHYSYFFSPTLFHLIDWRCHASLYFIVSWSLLKLRSTESVMPSNHFTLCCPLLLLPSLFPSIRVFPSELALHIRWPKYWSYRFTSVLPMNIQGWFPLGLTGLTSLLSKEFSRVCSSTRVQKPQFFNIQPSLWSNSHIHTLHILQNQRIYNIHPEWILRQLMDFGWLWCFSIEWYLIEKKKYHFGEWCWGKFCMCRGR